MCGGMLGAMSMSLEPRIRETPILLASFTLAYNLGRISSYVAMGFLFGLFGEVIRDSLMPENGLMVMRIIASLLIIAMGFFIAGWFPQFSIIEKLGAPIWRFLQPVGVRLLPVKNIGQAFLFGGIWGWLPCGLVYYALLISPANDGAINSALFMLFFGLGTLMPLMCAGIIVGKLARLRQSYKIRITSGVLLIVMGLIGIWLIMNPALLHHLHFHPF